LKELANIIKLAPKFWQITFVLVILFHRKEKQGGKVVMLLAKKMNGRFAARSARGSLLLSLIIAIMVVLAHGGCSVEKMAVQSVADMLGSGGGTVFTGEEDPKLVRDALPFALKLYESLLESAPDHRPLLLATGQGFVLYAYAFVQSPAQMLPEEEIELQLSELARAKKLYLRARRYTLRALDLRHPGMRDALFAQEWDGNLDFTDEEDVPYLYWAGMAWLGALTTDFFDMELLVTMPRAVALVTRILDLDEDYDNGAVHEFLATFYGSIPREMGGSEEMAREHYGRALDLSGGAKASTYLALATTVSVANQDVKEFRDLLEKALDVDVDAVPEYRLMNILAQEKARWLLEHVEDFFLILED
jgi:predicted anti-sigma-YlaC factor YlaD